MKEEKFWKLWDEVIWPAGCLISEFGPTRQRLMAERSALKPGERVLEVGAGYPFYKIYSDRVGRGGLFVALDIRQNIQKRSKRVDGELDLVTADAWRTPFPNESFDVIIASNLRNGWQSGFVNEGYRLLKRGGRLVFAFDNTERNEQFYDAALEAGFDQVNLFEITNGHLWARFIEAGEHVVAIK